MKDLTMNPKQIAFYGVGIAATNSRTEPHRIEKLQALVKSFAQRLKVTREALAEVSGLCTLTDNKGQLSSLWISEQHMRTHAPQLQLAWQSMGEIEHIARTVFDNTEFTFKTPRAKGGKA